MATMTGGNGGGSGGKIKEIYDRYTDVYRNYALGGTEPAPTSSLAQTDSTYTWLVNNIIDYNGNYEIATDYRWSNGTATDTNSQFGIVIMPSKDLKTKKIKRYSMRKDSTQLYSSSFQGVFSGTFDYGFCFNHSYRLLFGVRSANLTFSASQKKITFPLAYYYTPDMAGAQNTKTKNVSVDVSEMDIYDGSFDSTTTHNPMLICYDEVHDTAYYYFQLISSTKYAYGLCEIKNVSELFLSSTAPTTKVLWSVVYPYNGDSYQSMCNAALKKDDKLYFLMSYYTGHNISPTNTHHINELVVDLTAHTATWGGQNYQVSATDYSSKVMYGKITKVQTSSYSSRNYFPLHWLFRNNSFYEFLCVNNNTTSASNFRLPAAFKFVKYEAPSGFIFPFYKSEKYEMVDNTLNYTYMVGGSSAVYNVIYQPSKLEILSVGDYIYDIFSTTNNLGGNDTTMEIDGVTHPLSSMPKFCIKAVSLV